MRRGSTKVEPERVPSRHLWPEGGRDDGILAPCLGIVPLV